MPVGNYLNGTHLYKLMVEIERTYCRKCQTNRPIDASEEGFQTSSKCREKGRSRYHRLRDYYQEAKKHYYQNHKEDIAEKNKDYFKAIKDIDITCPVCNYEIKKYKKSQHGEKKKKEEEKKRISTT